MPDYLGYAAVSVAGAIGLSVFLLTGRAAGTRPSPTRIISGAAVFCAVTALSVFVLSRGCDIGETVCGTALFWLLLVCADTDVRTGTIPVPACLLIAAVFPVRIVFYLAEGCAAGAVFDHVFGGLAALAVSGVSGAVIRGGIGKGDIVLMTVYGLSAGFSGSVGALIISFALTVLAGLFVLVSKKGNLKSSLPFAPFLFAGHTAAFGIVSFVTVIK